MREKVVRVLELGEEGFRRLLGVTGQSLVAKTRNESPFLARAKPQIVKKLVFGLMLEGLEEREKKKTKTGRPAILSLEEQLVLTLEFYREYRSHYHLALEWNIDERTLRRTIERVESILIKQFKLLGNQAIYPNNGLNPLFESIIWI